MKNIITVLAVLSISITSVSASFMYQEIDPICSISGKTHTSFPGEISDTSYWNIPKAYDGACEVTPELSRKTKDNVYNIMVDFFENKNYVGPVYGEENGYGGDETLNQKGQDFAQKKLFPAIIDFIETERKKQTPNTRHIAIMNALVQTIGYDYYLQKIQ